VQIKKCNNPYGSRLSKDIVYNTERKKLTEFCKTNVFEILNRKYGSDGNGEKTFINQAGKSVTDNVVVSEGLISNLVEFRIGNEFTSSHMPLLIVIGNMLQINVNMESIVEMITHKLEKYKGDERAKSKFLDIMYSDINKYYMYGIITFFYKKARLMRL
jgi:hypothetical protein